MDAIKTSGLSKIFPGKRGNQIKALDCLDLNILQGEVFGFLGPNGAGKSTTIKILMGLIRPSGGNASLLGISSSLPESRRQAGYLPENPAFYDFLNAAEYLTFIGGLFGLSKEALMTRSEAVLRRLELWEARKRAIRGYSKGMVQRLGLAQVLLHEPEIYILDEPMSGLDPVGRALVKEIIRELKAAGKCVFFSTHITSDVEAVCDRVGIILNGQLQSVETVEDIMSSGITGYQVIHRCPGDETVHETTISKAKFQEFINELHKQAGEIISLQPQRKSLEDFFLDIVRQGNASRN